MNDDLETPLAHVVAEAVGQALDKRMRWMVALAATAALVVSLLVSIPLTLLENASTDHAATIRSIHNCRLLTDIADVMGAGNRTTLKRGGFLSTDAALRRAQVLTAEQIQKLHAGALKQLLVDPETVRLQQRSRRLDQRTTRYWQRTLIPRLLDVARVDCSVGS